MISWGLYAHHSCIQASWKSATIKLIKIIWNDLFGFDIHVIHEYIYFPNSRYLESQVNMTSDLLLCAGGWSLDKKHVLFRRQLMIHAFLNVMLSNHILGLSLNILWMGSGSLQLGLSMYQVIHTSQHLCRIFWKRLHLEFPE